MLISRNMSPKIVLSVFMFICTCACSSSIWDFFFLGEEAWPYNGTRYLFTNLLHFPLSRLCSRVQHYDNSTTFSTYELLFRSTVSNTTRPPQKKGWTPGVNRTFVDPVGRALYVFSHFLCREKKEKKQRFASTDTVPGIPRRCCRGIANTFLILIPFFLFYLISCYPRGGFRQICG